MLIPFVAGLLVLPLIAAVFIGLCVFAAWVWQDGESIESGSL